MKHDILVIFESFLARGENGKTAPHLEAALDVLGDPDFSADYTIIIDTIPKRKTREKHIRAMQENHDVLPKNTFVITSDMGNIAHVRKAGAHAVGVAWRESLITNAVAKEGMRAHGAVATMFDFAELAPTLTERLSRKSVLGDLKPKIPFLRGRKM